MLDTIILLSGPAEQATLPAVLLGHNPLLTVITVGTCAGLATVDCEVLRRARLIAFVTPEIVPKSILAGWATAPSIFILARPATPDGRRPISHFTIRPPNSA